jgi:hypothetical protein
MDKPMTIRQAMRELRLARKTHYALAKALGTKPQTVDYWRDKMQSLLPALWADRVKLMVMTNGNAANGSRARRTD